VARDRQRAKERQAQRRAARAAASRGEPREELGEQAGPLSGLTGAPPENVGRSDTVAKSPPPEPLIDNRDHLTDEDTELDDVDPELEADAIEAGALGQGDGEVYEDELEPADGGREVAARGPRGVRGAREEPGARAPGGAGKVLNFLKACWAELQRVQWPDRRTLTQLTGIVLFFCVLAGAYLGLLDAVFSKLIQAIL
jgi:preprotein translocase SecE subunit